MSNEFIDYETFAKRMEDSYPKMFEGKYGGFAVGKGWYPILERLCSNIQHHIDWKEKQGNPIPQVTVAQIKEKFGGLRFYYDGGDDEISGMVRMAESWADIACEVCGAPGSSGGKGWIKTLCPIHRAESDTQYNERFKDENQTGQ
jgi:hypothetical protein